MSQRIRIKDIALKAGVSKGTVDRVLHKRGKVSAEALKKVEAAMKDLDYQPNVIASALSYNREWQIAAFVPKHEYDQYWLKPKLGIERAMKSLRDYGVSIQFFEFNDDDEKQFNQLSNEIIDEGFDAVLITPIFAEESHRFLDLCVEAGIPYLQINTYLKRADACFLSYIGQDSYQSGVLAAKLLNFGVPANESVLMLHLEKDVLNSMHLVEKEKGFRDFFAANKDRNIKVLKHTFEEFSNEQMLTSFLENTFKTNPGIKGIFVTTSKLYLIANKLFDMGLSEVKLVGFDLVDKNLALLKQDKIDFLINQNPIKQGFLGIMSIFNHLVLKKDLPITQHLPLDVVMRENMEYYLNQEEEQLHLVI